MSIEERQSQGQSVGRTDVVGQFRNASLNLVKSAFAEANDKLQKSSNDDDLTAAIEDIVEMAEHCLNTGVVRFAAELSG
jgi:hypothetical protein